jgi:hypothetical protein
MFLDTNGVGDEMFLMICDADLRVLIARNSQWEKADGLSGLRRPMMPVKYISSLILPTNGGHLN